MRTYEVIRSSRTPAGAKETVERTGLTHPQASAEREKLQEVERLAHPGQTSWTYDIFSIRLESEQ